jgi:ferredoxin-nitrite reductase
MNKFEEIKATKDGLDALPDIEHYATEGWEAIADDDKVRMKWYGLFFRRHIAGHFMLRIRVPNGIATAVQLRALAGIARDFGREHVDITTRQQVQVRWFRIEQVPEIFSRLADVGLTTRQTGMDNIRNVMGCPLAGLTTHELFDASTIARSFTERFVGNREFTNLPRKFNVTVTSCTENCVHLETQDIGLGPALKAIDGRTVAGFNVLVGGKNGSGGFAPARPLDVFVPPEEATDLCAEIALIFRDHGPRETRSRARLAFLLDDWGIERFREELELRLGRIIERAGFDARRHHRTDHLGVSPQRQHDAYAVGLAVPMGRLATRDLLELADVADYYGQGAVRLTPEQNVILTDVPATSLPKLLMEPLLEKLRPDASSAVRGTVSCTGLGTCDLALAETKELSLRIARRLEQNVSIGRPLSLNWSGCPAGCANHQAATIGLQGDKARIGDEVIEVFHVYVGGQTGPDTKPGRQVLGAIPADRVGDVVEHLAREHAAGADLEIAARQLVDAQAKAEDAVAVSP